MDTFGNRTTQTPAGPATSKVGSQSIAYTHNKNHAFNYDSAGNTTNDGTHTYAYNAENQQTVMDGGAATYACVSATPDIALNLPPARKSCLRSVCPREPVYIIGIYARLHKRPTPLILTILDR